MLFFQENNDTSIRRAFGPERVRSSAAPLVFLGWVLSPCQDGSQGPRNWKCHTRSTLAAPPQPCRSPPAALSKLTEGSFFEPFFPSKIELSPETSLKSGLQGRGPKSNKIHRTFEKPCIWHGTSLKNSHLGNALIFHEILEKM